MVAVQNLKGEIIQLILSRKRGELKSSNLTDGKMCEKVHSMNSSE
jgi:hypothetical protein